MEKCSEYRKEIADVINKLTKIAHNIVATPLTEERHRNDHEQAIPCCTGVA
jgi:hypothetical protein